MIPQRSPRFVSIIQWLFFGGILSLGHSQNPRPDFRHRLTNLPKYILHEKNDAAVLRAVQPDEVPPGDYEIIAVFRPKPLQKEFPSFITTTVSPFYRSYDRQKQDFTPLFSTFRPQTTTTTSTKRPTIEFRSPYDYPTESPRQHPLLVRQLEHGLKLRNNRPPYLETTIPPRALKTKDIDYEDVRNRYFRERTEIPNFSDRYRGTLSQFNTESYSKPSIEFTSGDARSPPIVTTTAPTTARPPTTTTTTTTSAPQTTTTPPPPRRTTSSAIYYYPSSSWSENELTTVPQKKYFFQKDGFENGYSTTERSGRFENFAARDIRRAFLIEDKRLDERSSRKTDNVISSTPTDRDRVKTLGRGTTYTKEEIQDQLIRFAGFFEDPEEEINKRGRYGNHRFASRGGRPTKSKSAVSFNCPKSDGYFPDEGDCTKYYQCAHGTAKLDNCKGGLVWNTVLNQCDWPHNTDCSSRPLRGKKASSVTPSPYFDIQPKATKKSSPVTTTPPPKRRFYPTGPPIPTITKRLFTTEKSSGITTRAYYPTTTPNSIVVTPYSSKKRTLSLGSSEDRYVPPTTTTPPPPPTTPKPKKYVYLTFEDGPNEGTEKVLNVLEEEKVPATFFINSHHLHSPNKEIAQVNARNVLRIVNEGHILGDHSYDHMRHNSPDTPVGAYLNLTEDFKFFGQRNVFPVLDTLYLNGFKEFIPFANRTMRGWIRMPYTNNWRIPKGDIRVNCFHCTRPTSSGAIGIELADILSESGRSNVIGWDYEWPMNWDIYRKELKGVKAFEGLKSTKTQKPQKAVLLAHDIAFRPGRENYGDELRSFIRTAKDNGYVFRKVDSYLTDSS